MPRTTCSYRDKIQRYMLANPGAQVLKGSTYVPIFTISALKEID